MTSHSIQSRGREQAPSSKLAFGIAAFGIVSFGRLRHITEDQLAEFAAPRESHAASGVSVS